MLHLWRPGKKLLIAFCALASITVAIPVQALGQSEPSEAQYSVYSAFLRAQLEGKNGTDDLRVGRNGSVIISNIRSSPKERTASFRRDIRARFPAVEEQTLRSFESCSRSTFQLTKKLTLPTEYALSATASRHRKYGYIEFSCVGLNNAANQALFFVSRSYCDCAVGKWVLMKKQPGGQWAIVRESVGWIA